MFYHLIFISPEGHTYRKDCSPRAMRKDQIQQAIRAKEQLHLCKIALDDLRNLEDNDD